MNLLLLLCSNDKTENNSRKGAKLRLAVLIKAALVTEGALDA